MNSIENPPAFLCAEHLWVKIRTKESDQDSGQGGPEQLLKVGEFLAEQPA